LSRTKVAHLISIDTSISVLLLNQLVHLKQAGFEVVAISSYGEDIDKVRSAGIRHIPITFTRRLLTPLEDLKTFFALYKVFRREHFSIVHTHFTKPGFLGRIAAKLAGVPIIIHTVHGFYFHDYMNPYYRKLIIFLERIGAGVSDCLLSQNKEDINLAINERICNIDKIHYLGNGINLNLFNPDALMDFETTSLRNTLKFSENTFVVGFVGRLAAKRKGFIDFLAAGQIVKQSIPDVRFLIVGEADEGKPDAVSHEVARNYDLEENCIFIGWQPNESLPGIYSLMNVLVLPSLFEGIPRVLMEANSMNLPVVATNVKGNRELIEDGVNGLLVEYGDVKAIAEAVLSLHLNTDQAQNMGKRGREIALEKFDENTIFEKVTAEYFKFLKKKGK
jgi:glycosyltransferase involved in cell wall biosynthesis